MTRITTVLLSLLLLVAAALGCAEEEEKAVTVFAGSASKPALEDAAAAFTEQTGTRIYLNFGGSGTVLAQMKVSKSGDLYIPGSPDYMAIAVEDGVADAASVQIVAYLVPAILVPAGNPQDIQGLADLARPGLEIGIGNPEAVCVGLYAYEIIEYNGLLEAIRPNIVTHAESCSKTASLVALDSVDAILGWRVFSAWHNTVDAVYLEPQQLPRLAYIPGAVSHYAQDRDSAQAFLDYLTSPEGQQHFSNWGYLPTEAAAREYAPGAAIGGEYELPENYRAPVQ